MIDPGVKKKLDKLAGLIIRVQDEYPGVPVDQYIVAAETMLQSDSAEARQYWDRLIKCSALRRLRTRFDSERSTPE